MKTMFLKNGIITMLMFAMLVVALPSCNKDNETPEPPFEESLVGTWDITSYVLDGDEWVGFIIEAGVITFETPTDHAGIFTQEVTFADGATASLSGRYIVDEDQHQVVMYYAGEPITAAITITGNKMLWNSLADGYPLVLKATKR